ncbi:hypothetical protein RZ63_08205 [[Haemophilus] ducreyi]|jgi:hypothetical protein|uniref:hypothetical protein n=1 Tax=Haemophilus ducreyi TaxID=730 RepID=UPI000655E0B2|nr:hypothetical protein [[Haemophilus] ducreyi]AKO38851.1 hypothetical protein RZ62_08315 [[Haemophilus] ducreyi]AKO40386.1 hypothetical protein RZ63_08205 [[Haemophilus] ducreyi]
MPVQLRYPLPFYSAVVITLSTIGGCGWLLYSREHLTPWTATALALGALLLAAIVAALLWYQARLLCQWVVVMVPPAWAAHADEVAGAHGQYRQHKRLKRNPRPARIKKGSLIVPISTTSGGALSGDMEEQARKMCEALQLSAVRVKKPKRNKNTGYVLFVFSLEDAAV